ncbi:MAG TPA: iron-containing redox enzyme family protein [Chloroflexota bacterium]|nr:iron-containing redox enzyme family protein [Chloroflexota bacterium]
MTSREFVQQFKAEIAAHPKLRARHPFVKAVQDGRVSKEHLREWARQDYKFRNIVPRVSMLRYLACSDPEFGRRLYGVVEEETEGLATGSAGHIDLFVDFAKALGLSRAELDEAPLAPSTAAHLYFVELMILKYPWFVVMAAQMAAEGTFPEATEALANGLMEHYGLSREAVRFFTVHKEADEDHSSLAEEIAEAYLHSPALQQQTREVGLRRFELLYDTWTITGYDLRG